MRALYWKIPRSYRHCGECTGLTLIPKLTPEELDELYSDYYLEDGTNPVTVADDDSNNWIKKYKEAIRFLRTQELDSKTFLDFGCGVDGYGIQVAKEVGLTVSGLEVSERTRTILKEATNCTIYSPVELQLSSALFDYILLSDVLEHASEPSLILEQATQHLSANGVLLIQGPLEGTRSFTNLFLRIYSLLTLNRVSNSLPYHVSLANQQCMKALLTANGLKIEKQQISETWWPAPRSISSLKTLPKVLPQIIAKLLDFTASFLLPSYGSRFWLVASKSIQ
jgi:2-polyprenyl-3-methyl-5-hydroxy-6-metoxy-1,4-benzoquinol methylase